MRNSAPRTLPKLLQLLYEQLAQNPDRVAYRFVDEHGESRITDGELLYRSLALAKYLSAPDAPGPKRALLIFKPGFDFIITLLGCFWSNITVIPIALPRPRTAAMFGHFLQHCNPEWIITTEDLMKKIEVLLPDNCSAKFVVVPVSEPSDSSYQPASNGSSAAVIQYTSGTTRLPKGVVITFDNLLCNLKAIRTHFKLSPESICFSWLPHYHDMGLIDGLLSPLFCNCEGVICSPHRVIAAPLFWFKAIHQYRVTHTGGPNFIFDLCAERINESDLDGISLSSLQDVYVSAEPVRKETLVRFAQKFRRTGFNINCFTPGYGLAEATLMVTCKPPLEDLIFTEIASGQWSTALGQPIPGVEVRIVDLQTHQELQDGQAGEIVIKGPTVTSGYHNDPAASRDVFIELPESQEVYLLSGDIGMIINKHLYVLGRRKDTLVIRGTQYYAEDLEYPVGRCHPGFLPNGTAAVGIDAGKGESLVVLQEIKRTHWPANHPEEMIQAIQVCLYDQFGLQAHDIRVLPPGKLPKTSSGKMRRSESRKMYLDGRI